MESIEAKIDESIRDFFEEHFPTYDMAKYAELLVIWLEDDGFRIVKDERL